MDRYAISSLVSLIATVLIIPSAAAQSTGTIAGRVTDDVRRVLGRPPRGLRTFVEGYRDVWTVIRTGADTEVDSGSPVDIDTGD
jgi:hypothetical protein